MFKWAKPDDWLSKLISKTCKLQLRKYLQTPCRLSLFPNLNVLFIVSCSHLTFCPSFLWGFLLFSFSHMVLREYMRCSVSLALFLLFIIKFVTRHLVSVIGQGSIGAIKQQSFGEVWLGAHMRCILGGIVVFRGCVLKRKLKKEREAGDLLTSILSRIINCHANYAF